MKNIKKIILTTLSVSLSTSVLISPVSEAANPSRAEVSNWLSTQVGQSYASDSPYLSPQCVDWVNGYFKKFWNQKFTGNAYDFKDNPIPKGWKIQPYYHGMVPKVGDVIVGIGGKFFPDYAGHVAIVKSANRDTLETYDQNFSYHSYVEVFGNHSYSGITHIITPLFDNEENHTIAKNTNIPTITTSTSNNSTSNNKAVEVENTSGTHVFDKYSYIRDQPLANATVIAYYNKGDKVFYDKKLVNDGYRWVSYISYGGNRRYVAIEKLINASNNNISTNKINTTNSTIVLKPIEEKSSSSNLDNQSNVTNDTVAPKVVEKKHSEDVVENKVIIKNESGTYYFKEAKPVKPTYDINSETLAEYVPGMSVHHDQKVLANGYEWLSYIGYSGNRRYIPVNVIGLGAAHGAIDERKENQEITEPNIKEEKTETKVAVSEVNEGMELTKLENKEEKMEINPAVPEYKETLASTEDLKDVVSESQEEKTTPTISKSDEEKLNDEPVPVVEEGGK